MKYPIRSSSLYRSILCPGWHWLAEETQVEPPAEAARSSDVLHPATARAIAEVTGASVEHVGEPTDELTEQEQQWVDRCVEVATEHSGALHAVELAVEFGGVPGTLDHAWRSHEGAAVIHDWKFYRHSIPRPAVRVQLLAYAAGLMAAEPLGIHTVTARSYNPILDEIHEEDFTQDNLADVAVTLQRLHAEIEDRTTLRLSANPACSTCPAVGVCPVASEQARQLAVVPLEDVRVLTKERLEDLYCLIPTVEAAVKAIKEEGKRRHFEDGVDFERLVPVERRSGTSFKSARHAMHDIQGMGLMTASEIDRYLTLRMAIVDECAKRAAEEEGVTKKAAKAVILRAMRDNLDEGAPVRYLRVRQ